ncbi:MAG: peptide ABC transporter substrate-binding protein [Chloroflexota bacterium]
MRRLVALTVGSVMVVTACGGAASAPPASAGPTGGPAASATAAPAGGIVTVGLYQEPDNLNPYLAVQTASRLVRQISLEGLLKADPSGSYVPGLAAEVPTVENNGISADGLTITYKLKAGLKWSDGDPVTSADVKFTWDLIMDPANKVNSQTGYNKIASVATPDDTTVVVTFTELYAAALSLFSIKDAVLPAHVLKDKPLDGADFNRIPEGTGPFMITEWKSGDSIIADRNPNYREAGKPILDRVVFKIIPSNEVGSAQIRSGEIDILWNLTEAQIPEFEQIADVALQVTPSSNIEYLGLNLSMRGMADVSMPHPILGDRAVREALASAIDRTPIVNDLLNGKSEVATSPIGLGWAAPEGIQVPPYDPEKARSLLEGAGWKDTNGDGIREKGGLKLSLEISTPAGSQLRELSEQLLLQQFKAVGIDLVINNVPAATLFGNWAENGKLKRGDFDIVMDTWGADLDPDDFLSTLFTSDQIPTAANDGAGWNFFRLQDPALDKAIADGRASLDQNVRKAAYKTAAERIAENIIYIPLYKRSTIDAFRSTVSGQAPNPWSEFTWNAQDWSRAK